MAKKIDRRTKEGKTSADVNMWQDRISSAERFRQHYRETYNWDKFIQEYKCLWGGILPEEITAYNLPFSWAKTEVASLYVRDPHVEVNPLKRATIQQSKIRELVISDIIRRKKAKRELKRMLLDGLLIGHGWMKTGYTAEFDTMIDKEGNQLQSITSEDFFLYRVPWNQVTFNPDSINVPFDCRWMAHEFWVPIEEIKLKKGFKHLDELEKQAAPLQSNSESHNLHKKNMSASTSAPPGHGDEVRAGKFHDGTKFAQIYEIWDIKKREVKYMAPGVDKFLFVKPWPYKNMKGFPFSYFNPNPINDEPYGIPDIFTWHEQHLELMKTDHMIDDHVKKGNRQVALGEDNDILPESKQAYQEGWTGAILKFRSVAPDKLNTIPFLNVLSDVYPLRNIRKENILNTSGQSANERGATEKTSTRTFKELALIDRGAKNRRAERVDVFEDMMEDLFGKILALVSEFADIPYYVRVTGRTPQEVIQAIQQRPSAKDNPNAITDIEGGNLRGFTVDRKDLGSTGEEQFDVDIQVGSTIPMDRDNKVDMVRFSLEQAPKVGLIPGGPVIGALGKLWFEEMDSPELNFAMEQELQLRQQMQQQQAQASETQAQLQASQESADIQIKAEREASRNVGNEIKQQDADTRRFEALAKAKQEQAKPKEQK